MCAEIPSSNPPNLGTTLLRAKSVLPGARQPIELGKIHQRPVVLTLAFRKNTLGAIVRLRRKRTHANAALITPSDPALALGDTSCPLSSYLDHCERAGRRLCSGHATAAACLRSTRAQRRPQTRLKHAQGMGAARQRQGGEDDPASHQSNARVSTADVTSFCCQSVHYSPV